ncbi:MAG TPA: FUSC family protein [Jatrophihabitans sp.]|nr:FUSC family protein [Jatrophihabitans sp.]
MSLAGLLRSAARLDRAQSDPVVSLRNAVGVAAPLAVGTLLGNPAFGLPTTIGAIQCAFADRPGPYRLRTLRMLGTGLAAAVTSGLAVAASTSDAGSVVLLFVLAFTAGMLQAGGPSATQVGTASVAAALVIGHAPQPPGVAVHVALLVLAGGVLQTVLAVAAWPLGRHRPERLALGALYRELARAAKQPAGTRIGPPAGQALLTVRDTLYGLGHDHGSSVEAYRVLLDEAERIRREILIAGALIERLAAERNPVLAGLVRSGLRAAGDVLDELAAALEHARPVQVGVVNTAEGALRHATARLRDDADAPGALTRQAAAARLSALAGQLRAVVESARTGASEGSVAEERVAPSARLLRDPWAILRANLTPNSAVLRHAVRVSVLVAASDLVVRLAGAPRGYWVPLTVLVVLRPDFGTTLQRAVMRTVGTALGLLVATELVHWVPGGSWWLVALVFVFVFGMRFAGPGNIGLTAVNISGMVVVLLDIAGYPAHATLVDRSIATLIGGALAVGAVLALPAWERQYLPARLSALVSAYRDYLLAVVDVDAPDAGREQLQRTRARSRVARTNAQASIDRARTEPVPADALIDLGRTILAQTHRFAHATLAIDAVRRTVREAGGFAKLRPFLDSAADVLAGIEVAARTGRIARAVPRLRPLQEELADVLADDPEAVGGVATAAILTEASDRITNSLDTLVAELRRRTERPRPDAAPAPSGDR